jgi:glycosyltransferase involved in cell wall biosynthesis
MKILHPGIDLSKWPMRLPPRADEEGHFRLLFVGGDLKRKGAYTLLEAMSGPNGLAASGCVLDLCTQSGYLNDVPGLRELIQKTPGIRLHVDLTHADERLRTLYRHADAFILPTTEDSSSWTVLEAQATGVPVIATPIGGIPDLITAGETGMLVPVGDSAAIVEVVQLLRQDEGLRERLVMQARANVEQNFNATKNVAQLMGWIAALVEGSPLTAASLTAASYNSSVS